MKYSTKTPDVGIFCPTCPDAKSSLNLWFATSGWLKPKQSKIAETRLTTAIKMAWLAAGSKPVNHAMRAGRSFARENSGHPRARVAYLHEPSSIVSMAQTLLEILRLSNIRRQFFSGENCEAEAMEWLLQDD